VVHLTSIAEMTVPYAGQQMQRDTKDICVTSLVVLSMAQSVWIYID
jgi:hypothetical protein